MFDAARIHPVVIGTIFALDAKVSNAPLHGTGRVPAGGRPASGSVDSAPGPAKRPDDRADILCW